MPRTFDRRTPSNDKDPTRNDLDFDNPGGIIAQGAELVGGPIHEFFKAVGQLFGLPTPQDFVAGVAEGVGNVINGAVQFVNGLGGFFAGLVGGVINAVQIPILDPTKVLNLPGLLSGFQGLLNGIVRGHTGIPDAVGSVDDVEVVFGDVRQVQFGLITLADLQKAPDNAPFYASPNPFEDVSFLRRMLTPVETYAPGPITGSTGPRQGTDIAHTHPPGTLAMTSLVTTTKRPLFTIPAGTLALSALRITKDRIANTVRFMAGGDTPAGQLLVGLYLINPVNGNMTLVYDFGDVSAEVDTGPIIYECALEMAEDMLLDAGALYAVGILPLSGSFTVAGIPRQRSQPDPIIYQQGATELLSPQSSLPATITETALNHDASHCIWVSVGQTVPTTITPVTLTIDFDAYADNGNWVSPAVKNFGNGVWQIVDGKLYCTGPSVLFAVDYRKAFLTLQRCATDDMFTEVVIGSAWTSEPFGAKVMAHVRFNAEGTEGVTMIVTQQGSGSATVSIVSATDMFGTGTPRANSSGVFQALPSDRFRIDAIYSDDDGYTTFTCTRNGEPIAGAVWADAGDITPRGVAWRRGGGASTAASYNFAVHRAAGIDLFRTGDVAVSA